MARRGIDREQAVAPVRDERSPSGVRTRRRISAAEDRKKRLSCRGRIGLGMLLVAIVVDLAVFELSTRWSSVVNSDAFDGDVTARSAL